MADEIDRAQEREQQDNEISRQLRKPEGPAPTGFCLWCDEQVPDGHRFCDADCRDDWQKREDLNG